MWSLPSDWTGRGPVGLFYMLAPTPGQESRISGVGKSDIVTKYETRIGDGRPASSSSDEVGNIDVLF